MLMDKRHTEIRAGNVSAFPKLDRHLELIETVVAKPLKGNTIQAEPRRGSMMESIQQLAIPLKQSQIDAASRFWLEGNWESKEFAQLRQAFPNPDDAVSIKAIVVNALYGTNILAISRVADWVERVLKGNCSTGYDLVEE